VTHPIFLNGEGIHVNSLVTFEVVLGEKRREITKEWINPGKIKDINNKR
jgi:hypothetical protein